MNILTITSLFPNHLRPDTGSFIFKRMNAFSMLEGNYVQAIAPLPYYPGWIANKRWSNFHRAFYFEQREKIATYYPQYPLIPKISMSFHGLLMWLGIRPVARKLNRKKKVDLIDSHFVFPDGMAALLIAKELKVPIVISARGSDIHQYPDFKTIRPQIIWTLEHANCIITVCQALKDSIKQLGVLNTNIEVISNGIDSTQFQIIDRIIARKKLNLSTQKKIILTIGNLVPVKGHVRIIDAFHRIKEYHPDSLVFIIGDGPERFHLIDKIKKAGLEDYIFLIGHRPNTELVWWYNAADIFCLPSLREGWPNVLMESLSCGTPVVATNVFGTPEIIANKNLGILVQQNKESIAFGIIDALNRCWDRDIIRQHIKGRTWNIVAEEIHNLFEKVIKKTD